ncbi:MAG: acyl-CoA dehydrogenase, partial [Reyranella sp.]|nr:acyl-CoA dehydrogenase [Reyranella sp.]
MQLILPDLLSLAAEAESAADRYETEAREAVRKRIAPEGKVDAKLLEREQFAAHGFAWIATYVSAI